MKVNIHFEHADGTPDSFVVRADTIEKVREKVARQLEWRHGKNSWSEDLEASHD